MRALSNKVSGDYQYQRDVTFETNLPGHGSSLKRT